MVKCRHRPVYEDTLSEKSTTVSLQEGHPDLCASLEGCLNQHLSQEGHLNQYGPQEDCLNGCGLWKIV